VALAQLNAAQPDRTLLVVRVMAGWCGTCRWSAAHGRESLPAGSAERLQVIDVLIRGASNAPASAADLESWAAASDGLATPLADPDFQLRALFPERSALPLIAVVEARSRRVLAALSNPAPDELASAIENGLGDRRPAPEPAPAQRFDDRFSVDQWGMIQALALPAAPPPDPSNAHADDPAAAELGRALFSESKLSPTGVSCARCHWPELVFQEGHETPAQGVSRLDRNAPTTLLTGYHDTQLWDGRADSLWMQALAPIEAAAEFGSSRLFAVHALYDQYRAQYEAVFGPLPPLEDSARFPAAGGPGDVAWEALSDADRGAVTRAFVNIGKSIAAFERSQRIAPSPLDEYARGDLSALTPAQKDGLSAFFTAGCAQCHYGPLLSDGSFHNLRFPTGRHDRAADRGRIDGLPQLLGSEFNRAGPFSDAEAALLPGREEAALGAFKTPGLRGVGYTLPYGHGGSYWGLASLLEAIRTGGLPGDSPYAAGEADPFLVEFDPALTADLIEFLSSLRLDLAEPVTAAR